MIGGAVMINKPSSVLGVRHVQALLLFSALVLAFAMRVNMTIAVVAMTDRAQDHSFDWSMQVQSVVLSSFFWGYVVLQVPGGELAARFGGMVLISVSIGVCSFVSLLIPVSAYYGGWKLVCACRILQGLSQAVLFPSVHNLIGKWVPLSEKSRLGTIIYAGGQLGTALQLLVSGFIIAAWGWPAVFYTNGILGMVWVVAYMLLGADSPRTSKMITDDERLYIQNSLGHIGTTHKKLPTPWKALFTSLPFISLIVTHCGHNWGFGVLISEIPSYMKQVLGVDIKANGVMSALPYLAMYLLSFPIGFTADYVLKKKWLSVTACRKLSNSLGQWGPALALVGLCYAPAGNLTLAVALLTLSVGLNAGHFTGFMIVHIDMAPNFSGTLMGISNCFANCISIAAPLAAGAMLTNKDDPYQWHMLFYVSAAVYFFFNLFFVIFGSCKKQAWNDVPGDKDEENSAQYCDKEKS